MGLFDFLTGGKTGGGHSNVLEVAWAKSANDKFRRLSVLNPDGENLSGVSGIYIIWHGGVKPGWVYVGMSDDLAFDLRDAQQSQDIMFYNSRGGLYVTWQTFPARIMPGVFTFLNKVLQPEVRNPDVEIYKDKKQVKVLPPGYTRETFSQLL